MYTWEDAIARVQEYPGNSQSVSYDLRGLAKVFKDAQEIGVDETAANDAVHAPISNLRAAVTEMRRALRWRDPKYFAAVVKAAREETYKNLRLVLHTVYLERVSATRNNGHIEVKFTPEQFEELKNAMILRHEYVLEDGDEDPADKYRRLAADLYKPYERR